MNSSSADSPMNTLTAETNGSSTGLASTPRPGSTPATAVPSEFSKPKVSRRSVACKSCHGLKVKCTPADVNDPGGPCIRCLNANRTCEIDLNQTRKRRKKAEIVDSTDSPASPSDMEKDEIHKLRKQISDLQGQLHQKDILLAQNSSLKASAMANIESPPFISKFDLHREIGMLCESHSTLTDLTNALKAMADRRTTLMNHGRNVDIITAGLVSYEEAEIRLNLYRSTMYKFHPLLEIPSHVTVHDLQQTQPFLLNSIMSITNTLDTSSADLDKTLLIDNFAIQTVAVEVMVAGTKTVELVKSVILLCLWYNSPELFRHRRYHLLNTISVSMLHDLGIIIRPTYSFRNAEQVLMEVDQKEVSLEYQSLILILYSSTISICLMLRRTIYVKWTPYVEECCSNLEVSNIEKWKDLALFLRLSCLLEKIHQVIHTTELTEKYSSSSEVIIAELQRLLSAAKVKIKANDHSNLAYYYSVEAYLHEPCFKKVFSDSEDAETVKLTEKSIESISKCTNSCLNALWEYNKLSSLEVATIPLIYASRIIYTAGMLLRLRFLILSLPSHIEKDLIPQVAITAIQNVNRLVERASLEFPFNHFLKKTRLVVQLFIQTYATQVQELLRKNGETPQNLRPISLGGQYNEMGKLSHMFNNEVIVNHSNMDSKTEATGSSVPLDILSYAATYRRDSDAPDGKNGNGAPDSGNNFNVPAAPSQRVGENGNFAANLPQKVNPAPGSTQVDPVTGNPVAIGSRPNPETPAIVNPFDNSKIANPDQIENSFLSVTDEFWADLLSNDANRINFSNNTYNPQVNDEVFFT